MTAKSNEGGALPRAPLTELRLQVRRTSFRFSPEKPDGKPRRLYLSLDERDGDPKGFGMALGRVFRHRDRVTLIRTAELEALRAAALGLEADGGNAASCSARGAETASASSRMQGTGIAVGIEGGVCNCYSRVAAQIGLPGHAETCPMRTGGADNAWAAEMAAYRDRAATRRSTMNKECLGCRLENACLRCRWKWWLFNSVGWRRAFVWHGACAQELWRRAADAARSDSGRPPDNELSNQVRRDNGED